VPFYLPPHFNNNKQGEEAFDSKNSFEILITFYFSKEKRTLLVGGKGANEE